MAKTETEQRFDYLVSKIIWPYFKALGYKKRGNNFRYYDPEEEVGKIVNFQKSRFQDKDHISFTVNIGLYLPEFEFYHLGKKSEEKFTEPICAIRKRIGQITKKNSWYEIKEETDIIQLQQELEQDIVQKVITYLNRIKTHQEVIDRLRMESSDYLIAHIKTLYYNGFPDQAQTIITQEYKRASDVMKGWLDELKNELNL